jgi:hypothetical protein
MELLQLESSEGLLLATVAGPVSLNEAIEFYKKLCDVAVERRLDRILVDCLAVQGQLSDLERYELGPWRNIAWSCH